MQMRSKTNVRDVRGYCCNKKVLPLDDKDNGYYSVSWMKEFIQKQ